MRIREAARGSAAVGDVSAMVGAVSGCRGDGSGRLEDVCGLGKDGTEPLPAGAAGF